MFAATLAPVLSGSGASPAVTPVAGSARAGNAVAPVDPLHQEVRLVPVAPPQQVEPQTTLVWKADKHRKVRVDSPRGTRVWTASALASHDLPQAALSAYQHAASVMASTDPSCQLPWTLLAGIGRVESDHGRYGGSVLASDGVSRPEIIGVPLDGHGPVAAIHDTDNGKLDGDKVWDRAVGPMQFIPSTWAWAGRDGDGDGVKNPHDIDDTALAAAAYLCSGSGSVLDDATAKAAIFRYNPSDYYVALVQAFERGYRTGIFVIPSPPAPASDETPRDHKKKHKAHTDRPDRSANGRPKKSEVKKPAVKDKPAAVTPKPKPSPKPSPTPTPTPKPSTTPAPSPSAPALEGLTGTLAACGDGGWCLGDRKLDLGPDAHLADTAAHDYDGDGTAESISAELEGLAGTTVTLQVGSGSAPAVVYLVKGLDYRFGDGTLA
jgi:membrane-bound lytic murein transglycosylase B